MARQFKRSHDSNILKFPSGYGLCSIADVSDAKLQGPGQQSSYRRRNVSSVLRARTKIIRVNSHVEDLTIDQDEFVAHVRTQFIGQFVRDLRILIFPECCIFQKLVLTRQVVQHKLLDVLCLIPNKFSTTLYKYSLRICSTRLVKIPRDPEKIRCFISSQIEAFPAGSLQSSIREHLESCKHTTDMAILNAAGHQCCWSHVNF